MDTDKKLSNEALSEPLQQCSVSGSTTNIKALFRNLPLIGWGDKKIFKGTQEDIDFTIRVISGMAFTGLVLRRTVFLENKGKKNINDWYKDLRKEDNFQAYMLNNYDLINGEFVFEESTEELNKLSGVLLKYYR